jgi:hypothetical protein
MGESGHPDAAHPARHGLQGPLRHVQPLMLERLRSWYRVARTQGNMLLLAYEPKCLLGVRVGKNLVPIRIPAFLAHHPVRTVNV